MNQTFHLDENELFLMESIERKEEDFTMKMDEQNGIFALKIKNVLLFLSMIIGLNIALALFLSIH
ncbi:MAG: hypothetical protein H7X94_12790 [Vallitaleaceae bacterium]|nr:hypothetical protein [Vallitaleaceae bacterium]